MKRILLACGLVTITLFTFSNREQLKHNSALHSETKYPMQDTLTVKVQLEQTTMKDMHILFIADTATSNEAIGGTFGKDYGELMQYIQQNTLQPLKFMAFYHTVKAPWFMDVAVEVNQIPAELSGRIQSRTLKESEVVIAHMRGPYDQLGQAYARLEKWLKENNRKAKSEPFEVYINDHSAVKDPSEIQTNVYQPIN